MKVQHALAGLPFLGILVGLFFANSVEPYVLGLPFAMFCDARLGAGRRAPRGGRGAALLARRRAGAVALGRAAGVARRQVAEPDT